MDHMFEQGWAGVKSSQGTIYDWVRLQMIRKEQMNLKNRMGAARTLVTSQLNINFLGRAKIKK